MKEIKLGGNRLENGLRVKPYSIFVYDGDLHEMPERTRFAFENLMYASSYIPTNEEGFNNLNQRLDNAIKHYEGNPEKLREIASNLLSGIHQKFFDNFTCKHHAFYLLIHDVTNFSEEYAKKKLKLLFSHGLNSFNTDSICEDVKKKYIPNYIETTQAYMKAVSLIEKF